VCLALSLPQSYGLAVYRKNNHFTARHREKVQEVIGIRHQPWEELMDRSSFSNCERIYLDDTQFEEEL
jgi:hypothetical protein